jgi:uncharacterized lipoprotein YbaY/heat shock protein HslJ/uncharacterized lipoprotein NlpE involved in copper resistance
MHLLKTIGLACALAVSTAYASAESLTGTATYLERMLLPPQAVLVVALEDVSRADAPSVIIAETRSDNLGAPPFGFTLEYDPTKIDDRMSYNIRAQVFDDERLLFTTTTHNPVLTRGAGKQIDVIMQRIDSPAMIPESPKRPMTGAHGLSLPATFLGKLPAASGGGVDWHLDLWADQSFHLRRSYEAAASDPIDQIGRWFADPSRNALILQAGSGEQIGFELRGNGNLRLLDQQGQPIESELNYDLTAANAMTPTDVSLSMRGLFSYFADTALFSECSTGRSYPVMMEADYLALEKAYLTVDREPGALVMAVLDGTLTLREGMEGPPRMSLIVNRFDNLNPGETCDRGIATAELVNTYWRIDRIGDADITDMDGRREPHIVLRDGGQPSYSATVGCNQINGAFKLDGNRISFMPGAMTMMACPPPLDEVEHSLNLALSEVAEWRIDGQALELLDATGKPLIALQAVYLP